MTLTSEQLSDLRADIGDSSTPYAFTDDELQRLDTRAAGDETLTRVLAYRQLLANAVKFTDYTAGQTSESRSQIREALANQLAYYEDKVSGQLAIVGIRRKPPRDVDWPDEDLDGYPRRRYRYPWQDRR